MFGARYCVHVVIFQVVGNLSDLTDLVREKHQGSVRFLWIRLDNVVNQDNTRTPALAVISTQKPASFHTESSKVQYIHKPFSYIHVHTKCKVVIKSSKSSCLCDNIFDNYLTTLRFVCTNLWSIQGMGSEAYVWAFWGLSRGPGAYFTSIHGAQKPISGVGFCRRPHLPGVRHYDKNSRLVSREFM